jgi:curved DNA-binding protein CbpA/HJR/Mrr/RecB family endonuclease
MPTDPYLLLGISRTATTAEIEWLYSGLARLYYPDHNGGSDVARERFLSIQGAYELLRDPVRRAEYDRSGVAEVGAAWQDVAAATRPVDGSGNNASYRGSTLRSEQKRIEDDLACSNLRVLELQIRGVEEQLRVFESSKRPGNLGATRDELRRSDVRNVAFARQMESSERSSTEANALWVALGKRIPSQSEVDEAYTKFKAVQQDLRSVSRGHRYLVWRSRYFRAARRFRMLVTKYHQPELLAFLILGVVCCVPSLFLGMLLFTKVSSALLLSFAGFLLGFAIGAILQFLPGSVRLANSMSSTERLIRQKARAKSLEHTAYQAAKAKYEVFSLSQAMHDEEVRNAELTLRVDQLQKEEDAKQRLLEKLNELRTAREARSVLDQSLQRELEDLKRRLSSREHLISRNWRDLRGTQFELFLLEVFEELGYFVELVGGSGDQGADLIVTKLGRRTLIQAKGYGGSVDNASVQQAFTGMAFHRCHACVAITNSRFTANAIRAAEGVNCLLVDSDQMVALIRGEIM